MDLSALEASIFSDFTNSQCARGKMILHHLKQLYRFVRATGDTNRVLGNRFQHYFVSEDARALEFNLQAFYRDATKMESECMTEMLSHHDAHLGAPTVGPQGRISRDLRTPLGRIVFHLERLNVR